MRILQRFFDKVLIPSDPNQCWLWRASKKNGYGQFRYNETSGYAHIFIYEMVFGQVPEGKELDHKCMTPYCVNPWHMEPVTHKENAIRAKLTITHCPQGHEYSEENTYYRPNGHRYCKVCAREGNRRRRKEAIMN